MNDKQKEDITQLRKNGLGYKRISVITGVSLNTVKSYCRRWNVDKEISTDGDVCLLCQTPLHQTKGKKSKKFCSDACRMKWWNMHLNKVNRKAYTTHECLNCKKEFQSYANKERKYCSHECYVAYRFGGVSYD
ncbi:endogenous inhibitor of DNA gyrase (YacG/DUF329 family) [Streptococcus gallinaceus]|uniref:RNA polymerase subunit sigma-70 n=1 Tax=Streptococcus gallinaceus TaxID=165758 RepID=UPI00209E7A2A|nr:RNA polymerase subunit sigma-70 [Streptococcus gallinaceus]MCP1638621.1 endogenous inhibitor of DNA gyrase (YacG/DUF329 family) [Streptococcus gallinaceus]MCP1769292.1 endogenous inhibitor of DNA gyrase (YacG/DUF329 family) [Streptococcus gallinaceus]